MPPRPTLTTTKQIWWISPTLLFLRSRLRAEALDSFTFLLGGVGGQNGSFLVVLAGLNLCMPFVLQWLVLPNSHPHLYRELRVPPSLAMGPVETCFNVHWWSSGGGGGGRHLLLHSWVTGGMKCALLPEGAVVYSWWLYFYTYPSAQGDGVGGDYSFCASCR